MHRDLQSSAVSERKPHDFLSQYWDKHQMQTHSFNGFWPSRASYLRTLCFDKELAVFNEYDTGSFHSNCRQNARKPNLYEKC